MDTFTWSASARELSNLVFYPIYGNYILDLLQLFLKRKRAGTGLSTRCNYNNDNI
jgi:hypothetical protein